MVYKEHSLELYVNGQRMDLESQKSLNLRFQNVLYNPETITSTQAEYSFSFELPSTPNNDRAFDYANNLSKLNKFHQRWNAEVYADGSLIFEGSLTLNGFKKGMYQCNLVSVKVYSLDDIFGDSLLYDIPWYIPFDGAGTSGNTIDYYNSQLSPDAVFPLVSYGAFQKSPQTSDEFGNKYTNKFDIDKYNRWYVESFYPSLSMLQTLKKSFEYKGYNVGGDAFNNVYLKDIFMSCNLADEQSPIYNLGNPKFGQVSLSATLSTSSGNSGKTYYQQELNFPYFKVSGPVADAYTSSNQQEYNYSSAYLFDVLGEGTVTVENPTYMYQPDEKIIVIPADGFYKIEMSVSSTLNTTGSLNVMHHLYDATERQMYEDTVSLPVGFTENTPIEVSLVRNYEDNYELIKGKRNKNYTNGNPTDTSAGNVNDWLTCFPHEDAYNSTLPTKQNNLILENTQGTRRDDGSVSQHVGNRRASSVGGHTPYPSSGGSTVTGDGFDSNSGRYWSPAKLGYIYNDGEIMAYDQVVSKAFICGFSSFYGGVASVMKNGYSWSKSDADENYAFYPEIGYQSMRREAGSGNIVFEETQYNYNTYINTPISYVSSTNNSMNGFISCMVYLNKNDVLEVMAVHRGLETTGGTNVRYETTTNVNLKITAASPRTYNELRKDKYAYNSQTEFDYDLRLTNFVNKEKKISEWVQNVIDAYNLELVQDGKNVDINTKKAFVKNMPYAVDIDDRVNSADVEATKINYPSEMAVRYKIDTEEWGFEKSVYPQSKLNDHDWKDYGDSGFTVIKLSDDIYETSKSEKSLQFSYTWYDNFKWIAVDSGFTEDSGTTITLRMPVISKYTYMIPEYNYDESMKHDGYGLSQRFWFKPVETNAYVWTRTYPPERVQIYEPKNLWTNYRDMYLNLSYKTTEQSLLNAFFNVTPYLASNYVIVEVYLTPEEYKSIKNGAMVHLDSDLYIPVSISGFDPTGNNPTELKLIKKV